MPEPPKGRFPHEITPQEMPGFQVRWSLLGWTIETVHDVAGHRLHIAKGFEYVEYALTNELRWVRTTDEDAIRGIPTMWLDGLRKRPIR